MIVTSRERPLPWRRWTAPRTLRPGVNFVGPVEYSNGSGVSARAYVSALTQAGIQLNVIPWRLGFERLRPHRADYPSLELQPINLIHLNLDLLLAWRLLDRQPLRRIATPQRYNVAIVYWELASLRSEWFELIHQFDEIWCASSFIARSVAAVSARPTKVVRPAIDSRAGQGRKRRVDFGLPEDRFVFFYCADAGSILARKNPRTLIDAYLEEFAQEDGACCLIKLNALDPDGVDIREISSLAAGRKDVVCLSGRLSPAEMSELYCLIDCYVSPHRSEGLGLTILEAMNAEKPVIATPYGGVVDFVNAQTALLLDYRLAEVGTGNLPYPEYAVWADPLASSLRSAMRRMFSDPALAARIGHAGHWFARSMFAPERAADALAAEIGRIWSDGKLAQMQGTAGERAAPRRPALPVHRIAAAAHGAKALARRMLPAPVRAGIRRMLPGHPANAIRISMLLPVRDVAPEVLDRTVSSLLGQTYRDWELCICDNGSSMDATLRALERHRGSDPRIKIVRASGPVAVAAAASLAVEHATGQFVGLLARGGRFESGTVALLVRAVDARPQTDVLCPDEDEPDRSATWTPARLRSAMFVRPLLVVRKSVFLSVGPIGGHGEGCDLHLAVRRVSLPATKPG